MILSRTQDTDKCPHCHKYFTKTSNPPFFACSQSHTLCRECLDLRSHYNPCCPYCMETIKFNEIQPNTLIWDKLPEEDIAKVINSNQRNEIISRDALPPAIPVFDSIDLKNYEDM